MEYIFCDESGESSFSVNSAFKHFLICALVINDKKLKKLVNTIKRKETFLINQGWPKDIEIKANILHMMKRNNKIPSIVKNEIDGDSYIKNIMMSIIKTCNPRIDYFVVNKVDLTNESFKKAPYGIAYNFFAGKILVPLCVCYKNTSLIVDQRNKELHNQRHFDGYIHTKIFEIGYENIIEDLSIEIDHKSSIKSEGLRAVDFFSWSIFRKYEHNDDKFYNEIKKHICVEEKWYCK